MADDIQWPPPTARAALLSSPSGRRKFRQDQVQTTTSPGKFNLLETMRAIKAERDLPSMVAEEEEDEETLKLQLAAIEAKLKLRKLQQNKARLELAASGGISSDSRSTSPARRPTSASGTLLKTRLPQNDSIQVRVSPIRKHVVAVEPKSPSRVLLGIDKGITGADVSLRRARTVNHSSQPRMDHGHRPSSKASSHNRPHARRAEGSSRIFPTKSFSERMNEARVNVNENAQKREVANSGRTKVFTIDKAEIENYQERAEANTTGHTTSNQRVYNTTYSREEILQPSSTWLGQSGLKKSRTMPELNQRLPKSSSRSIDQRSGDDDPSEGPEGDASLYEGFSKLHLSSRILPHSFLKRTLPADQFTTFTIPDLLKVVKSPEYDIPNTVGDYAIFGVVASKSSPYDQKATRDDSNMVKSNQWEEQWQDGITNQKKFIVFTLTDLTWTIKLYLFGTAVPRYHRLSPGTVVAILNPGIMPPRKGKEDTGAFSLTLNDAEDTVLEIGKALHLGFCNAVKKDGRECGEWLNSSKTEICEWHLNAEIAKTQSGRMGLNSGSNGACKYGSTSTRGGFGPRGNKDKGKGQKPNERKQKFDRDSASFYFISRSGLGASNTGSLAEQDNYKLPGEEGFVFTSEKQLERDREARFAKKAATQEKEREIARQLSSSHAGGAGGEYLRHQTGNGLTRSKSHRTIPTTESGGGAADLSSGTARSKSVRSRILESREHHHGNDDATENKDRRSQATSAASPLPLNRKRTADSVRLSPVKIKKTRFLTDRGIKIAGRESFGGAGATVMSGERSGRGGQRLQGRADAVGAENSDEEDEDDLEIV